MYFEVILMKLLMTEIKGYKGEQTCSQPLKMIKPSIKGEWGNKCFSFSGCSGGALNPVDWQRMVVVNPLVGSQ